MTDDVAAALAAGQALVLNGTSYRRAGAEVGVDEKALRRHMRAAGTAPDRPRGSKLVADPTDVARMFNNGTSQAAIAVELGVSETAVRNALTAAGVQRLTRHPVQRRDLTDHEVAQLRALWASRDAAKPTLDRFVRLTSRLATKGVSMAAMSRAVGAERSTVFRLLSRAKLLPEQRAR